MGKSPAMVRRCASITLSMFFVLLSTSAVTQGATDHGKLLVLDVVACTQNTPMMNVGDLEARILKQADVMIRTTRLGSQEKVDSVRISKWADRENGGIEHFNFRDSHPHHCKRYPNGAKIVMLKGEFGGGLLCGNDAYYFRTKLPNPEIHTLMPEIAKKLDSPKADALDFAKDGIYRTGEKAPASKVFAVRTLNHQTYIIEVGEAPVKVRDVQYWEAYGTMFIRFVIDPIPRRDYPFPIVCLDKNCYPFESGSGGDENTI